MNLSRNENKKWIPGNEPEKEGEYQVTILKDGVPIVMHYWYTKNRYDNDKLQWTYYSKDGCLAPVPDGVIAHREKTYSAPYVPPIPDPETMIKRAQKEMNEKEIPEAIVTNHKGSFGNENWYVWTCPECRRTTHRGKGECSPCSECGTILRWEAKND